MSPHGGSRTNAGRKPTIERGQRYPMYLSTAQVAWLTAQAKAQSVSLGEAARRVIDAARWGAMEKAAKDKRATRTGPHTRMKEGPCPACFGREGCKRAPKREGSKA